MGLDGLEGFEWISKDECVFRFTSAENAAALLARATSNHGKVKWKEEEVTVRI